MNLKKLRIVVDEREKKSGIPDFLKKTGINLEIKTLQVGDYIVAPETVVERKTISDLASSIFDGRLFDQCNRLKEHYKFPILLIEGDIDKMEELMENPFIIYGAISSVAPSPENCCLFPRFFSFGFELGVLSASLLISL